MATAYDTWKTNAPDSDHEAREAAGEAIFADADRLADIIETEAQKLDGSLIDGMLATLAAARNTGLIRNLSNGTPADRLKGAQLEAFQDLADLCDQMGALINNAVAEAAGDELERQIGE